MELPGALADRLHRRLRREQVDARLPSVVAGVLRAGELVFAGGAGRVGADAEVPDHDTQYRIGSITKTMVAVAVLRLRDEGRLRLDDAVGDHVEDAPLPNATVGQLLSHAAGLPAEPPGPWWERTPGKDWAALAAGLAARPRAVAAGFHYSNPGYAVLGELLRRHRRAGWDRVVRDEVLTPLGMRRTTPAPAAPHAPGLAVHPWAPVTLAEPAHDAGAMAPAGQLFSTLEDLATWARFLAEGHPAVLERSTLAEMGRPLAVDDRPGEPWTVAHGAGLQVFDVGGVRRIGHGGSMPGHTALVRVDPTSGDGVVLACNSTTGFGGSLADDLETIAAGRAGPIAAGGEPVPWRAREVDGEVLALTGVWYWGPQPFVLRVDERSAPEGWAAPDEVPLHLSPLRGPGRASHFAPDGRDRWVGRDGYHRGEPLRVVRDAAGRATHLDLASFVLTRGPYEPPHVVPGGVTPPGWEGAPPVGE